MQSWRTIALSFTFTLALVAGALFTFDALPAVAQETPNETLSVATVGTGFTYQGELKSQDAAVNGNCDFQFSLWAAASGGSQIGSTQSVSSLAVDNGRFTALVNDGSEFGQNAFDGQARWLQLAVRCPSGSGSFTTLTPRQALSAVPYALFALAGNEGPQGEQGPRGATGPQGAAGEGFRTDCANGDISRWNGADWLCDAANDHNHGGQSWTGAVPDAGLSVENLSSGGQANGIVGATQSGSGAGLYGFNNAQTGLADGVLGISTGITGTGVAGSGNGVGVSGRADSSNGWGVLGVNSSGTGNTTGVYGSVSSPTGWGIFGSHSATSGNGVGVFGATASPTGWAGFFNGDVNVNGTLFKNAGAFRIDHPLDPENKYLSHSFVESSDMMNVYNGNVALDAEGTAWVQLPDWFEALNKDFRYQLTPIGGPGPNLYISETIQDNQFQIAGGSAGLTVSWQVTGIRHDPYAEANPIIVEQDKPTTDASTQLVPASADAPAQAGDYYQQRIDEIERASRLREEAAQRARDAVSVGE